MEGKGGFINQISDVQLYRWMEYYQLEPFGEKQDELRHALGYSMISNSIRAIGAGLGGGKFSPIDLDFFRPSEEQKPKIRKMLTIEEQKLRFQEEKATLLAITKTIEEGGR